MSGQADRIRFFSFPEGAYGRAKLFMTSLTQIESLVCPILSCFDRSLFFGVFPTPYKASQLVLGKSSFVLLSLVLYIIELPNILSFVI